MIVFDPNMHLREIAVVGLGGTGAVRCMAA